jgi:predicted regulator of Ras-like GTPase activity (Roadblock/LC7/MglB family)
LHSAQGRVSLIVNREPRPERETAMITRQSELQRVLGSLLDEIGQADWVALVDQNGLMVSSAPAELPLDSDRVAAMTAASAQAAERVLDELEGGTLRFATIAGAKRQHLTVFLSRDRLLAIGLPPEAEPQTVIPFLMHWVPELVRVLKRRYVTE